MSRFVVIVILIISGFISWEMNSSEAKVGTKQVAVEVVDAEIFHSVSGSEEGNHEDRSVPLRALIFFLYALPLIVGVSIIKVGLDLLVEAEEGGGNKGPGFVVVIIGFIVSVAYIVVIEYKDAILTWFS